MFKWTRKVTPPLHDEDLDQSSSYWGGKLPQWTLPNWLFSSHNSSNGFSIKEPTINTGYYNHIQISYLAAMFLLNPI